MSRKYIKKSTGEKELFKKEKLERSLLDSGADPELVARVLIEIEPKIHSGMHTRSIYRKAFRLLKKYRRPLAARYHLKKAIMELGPSGYPFEHFVSRLFESQGYQVAVGQILQGHCVKHEVDVVAWNDSEYIVVECKYRNTPGYKCDVKVPLYIHSRFEDIEKEWRKKHPDTQKSFTGWVATNARFSGDAIRYSECVGLKLLSWDYPHPMNLKNWVDTSGLYPVTALSTLTKREKQELLKRKVVLVRDLQERLDYLAILGIGHRREREIKQEIATLRPDAN